MLSRLWVISELYYPEDTSTGHYMTRIAEGLAEDCDVHALCVQPTYSKRGHAAPRSETHRGVKVLRCWSTRLDKNVAPFKVINALTAAASMT